MTKDEAIKEAEKLKDKLGAKWRVRVEDWGRHEDGRSCVLIHRNNSNIRVTCKEPDRYEAAYTNRLMPSFYGLAAEGKTMRKAIQNLYDSLKHSLALEQRAMDKEIKKLKEI